MAVNRLVKGSFVQCGNYAALGDGRRLSIQNAGPGVMDRGKLGKSFSVQPLLNSFINIPFGGFLSKGLCKSDPYQDLCISFGDSSMSPSLPRSSCTKLT